MPVPKTLHTKEKNSMKNRYTFYYLSLIYLLSIWPLKAQNTSTFEFKPSTQKGVINWQQFPAFSLPFTLIYNGPRFQDPNQEPLKHGFSHLSNFNQFDSQLPLQNRAIIWYGVASIAGQPWYEKESPWNNNLAVYRSHWENSMRGFAGIFADTQGKDMPNIDILVLDIERERPSDASIRTLRNDSDTPKAYQQLSDEAFLERYKRDLTTLYASPVSHLAAKGLPSSIKIASYSDAPIKNKEYPAAYSWKTILNEASPLNYYMKDSLTQEVGGPFYQQNTILTPSAYFCYEYSVFKEYGNVAYQLFQVEANKARSNKDIILFEWLNYNKCQASNYNYQQNIPNYLVDAQAILPFFSGAKGIFLWEGPIARPDTINFSVYERYINALYRLSQYKDFFVGNYQLHIPKTAHQHFLDRDPLWRGVVKDNQILIAAINEFADDTQTTELTVRYGNWSKRISLKGKETFLQAFPLDDTSEKLIVFPNPNQGSFWVEYTGKEAFEGEIKVFDYRGIELFHENIQKLPNPTFVKNRRELTLGLPTGNYILKFVGPYQTISQKISVTK